MAEKAPVKKKFANKKRRYFEDDKEEDKGSGPGEHSHKQTVPNIKAKGDGTEVVDLSNFNFSAGRLSTTNFSAERPGAAKGKPQDKVKKRKPQKSFHRPQPDPFPGDAPVPWEKVKKYRRGDNLETRGIRKRHRPGFEKQEKKIKDTFRKAARAELLLQEDAGYIDEEEDEQHQITQHEIANNVDVLSAQKFFELKLDKFGPYRINYTRNGRFLLIGGNRGHVAAMDWQTKKLMCEVNVMETVQDVKWLHHETMFAVAQKQWVYMYDNQGIELHCIKRLDNVLRMEFLPYHFLLATGNAKGFLTWLDVSVGKQITAFPSKQGRLDVMCQNPRNAIIHCGHSGGTVTMWSPNVKEPLVKMLCNNSGTRAVAVTNDGLYMATSGMDRTMKIWDLRTYKALQSYKLSAGAGHLAFSQRNLLAAGIGNIVEIYKDCIARPTTTAYLSHRLSGAVKGLQFCPYEDVLGVGHSDGFSSLLVPGSGESNFDALEANPYQSKKQRQEAEVKMLLDKIQPDLISLDTSALAKIDKKTLQEEMEEKAKIKWLKPQKIDFEPRYKKKGKSKGQKLVQRKKGVVEEAKRQEVKDHLKKKQMLAAKSKSDDTEPKPYNIFSRFSKSE